MLRDSHYQHCLSGYQEAYINGDANDDNDYDDDDDDAYNSVRATSVPRTTA